MELNEYLVKHATDLQKGADVSKIWKSMITYKEYGNNKEWYFFTKYEDSEEVKKQLKKRGDLKLLRQYRLDCRRLKRQNYPGSEVIYICVYAFNGRWVVRTFPCGDAKYLFTQEELDRPHWKFAVSYKYISWDEFRDFLELKGIKSEELGI